MTLAAERTTRTTYGSVQLSLACSFALLLLALTTLRVSGETLRAPGLGDLPALCASDRSPCPSCGLTRGLVAAFDLDLDEARGFHRGAIPLAALLSLQIALRLALATLRLRGRTAAWSGAADFLFHFAVVGSLMNGAPPIP